MGPGARACHATVPPRSTAYTVRPSEPRKKAGPSDLPCSPPSHRPFTATLVRWPLASNRQPSDSSSGSPLTGVPTAVGVGDGVGRNVGVGVAVAVGLGCRVLVLFQCRVGDDSTLGAGLPGEARIATTGVVVGSTVADGAVGPDPPQLASIQATRQAPRVLTQCRNSVTYLSSISFSLSTPGVSVALTAGLPVTYAKKFPNSLPARSLYSR